MTSFGDVLREAFPDLTVQADAPLAPLTTFKVGGPADWLVEPHDGDTIVRLVSVAHAHGVPVTLLGGGSNVLVADAGVRGLVIRPRGGTIQMVGRDLVRVDVAVTINALVRWTVARGLGGLEAWAGTPGTVGGALYGNAHWRQANIGDVVESVRVAEPRWRRCARCRNDRMEFAYDTSRLQRSGEVAIWAALRVHAGQRSRRPARGGPRVARVPQADAAAGVAECRLHLPEPATRPRPGARRHPAVGGRPRRSRGSERAGHRRRSRVARRTATSSSTRARPRPRTSPRSSICAARVCTTRSA